MLTRFFLELFRIYSVIIRIIVAEMRVIVTLIVEFRIFSILFYPGFCAAQRVTIP